MKTYVLLRKVDTSDERALEKAKGGEYARCMDLEEKASQHGMFKSSQDFIRRQKQKLEEQTERFRQKGERWRCVRPAVWPAGWLAGWLATSVRGGRARHVY
eukprot:COSAG01_NODE_5588_length_4161_cov_133.480059_1_plen_101_part_00